MNAQQYIQYLVQQQLNDRNQGSLNTLNGYINGLNTANKLANGLQTTGNYLQGFDNNIVNNLGSGISKAGNFINNGVSAIKDVPKNVFTGFAQPTNPAITSALNETLGSSVANTGLSTIGNAVADTAGSSLAGVGSTIGGSGAAAGASALGGMAMPLVGLAVAGLQGTNRKRGTQAGQNQLNQLNQMTNSIENDTSTQDFANQMVQQAQNNIAGNMTGGASPVKPDVVGLDNEMSKLGFTPQQKMSAMNGLNGGNKTIASLVDKYNIPKTQLQTPVATPVETPIENNNNTQTGAVEETKRSLLSKFMSGIGDFAQGYQENRNTGFKPENFDQNRFAETTTTYAPNQQLIDYQNSLRNNQDFIKWANNAQKDKEAVINNIANGENGGYAPIDEWIKANPDALKPVANTQTTYTGKEKGKMARFGEGVGTIARALQNPNFQAVVAGGLGAALTGNPLYGLGLGYKFANQRAMSDAYRNVLKQYGVDIPDTGTFGNITGQDMKNIGSLAETHAWHQYLNQRNIDELKRKIAKDEVDKQYKENKMLVDKQNADSRTTTAQARMINANKPKGGGKNGAKNGGGKTQPKPQQHPDWKNDLAEYYTLINNPKYATKIPQIKARFMSKYGEDPDKHIKD